MPEDACIPKLSRQFTFAQSASTLTQAWWLRRWKGAASFRGVARTLPNIPHDDDWQKRASGAARLQTSSGRTMRSARISQERSVLSPITSAEAERRGSPNTSLPLPSRNCARKAPSWPVTPVMSARGMGSPGWRSRRQLQGCAAAFQAAVFC
jgi:hypothetical protein